MSVTCLSRVYAVHGGKNGVNQTTLRAFEADRISGYMANTLAWANQESRSIRHIL
jgi:hypothetical protein